MIVQFSPIPFGFLQHAGNRAFPPTPLASYHASPFTPIPLVPYNASPRRPPRPFGALQRVPHQSPHPLWRPTPHRLTIDHHPFGVLPRTPVHTHPLASYNPTPRRPPHPFGVLRSIASRAKPRKQAIASSLCEKQSSSDKVRVDFPRLSK